MKLDHLVRGISPFEKYLSLPLRAKKSAFLSDHMSVDGCFLTGFNDTCSISTRLCATAWNL